MLKLLIMALVAVACVPLVGAHAAEEASAASGGSGYWMLSEDGHVYSFGDAPRCTGFGEPEDEAVVPYQVAVDITADPVRQGYWILTDNVGGGIASTTFHYCPRDTDPVRNPGDATSVLVILMDWNAEEHARSISMTPDGRGYWVFTDRGRVLPVGTAHSYGDLGGVHLNGEIIDSVATPSGRGYWMVGSDGGVFSFGDAQFYGSMGGVRLNKRVMSMAPDPDGRGYWLVAEDGGVFAFDAPFYGSTGSLRLNQPISGTVPSPTGAGYLMTASDGGIFAFGDVPFHGSLGANPPSSPIVSVAVMP